MPLRRTVAAAFALAVLGPIAPAHAAPPPSAPKLDIEELPRPARPDERKETAYDPNSVLVRFKRGASAAAKDKALTGRGARSASAVAGTGYVKVRTQGAATDMLRELRRDPAVESVSLDYRRHLTAVPNDPGYAYGDQNYLNTIRLPQAWDRTKGSATQVIAVVDTGVDVNHPDLKGRTVPGYNAVTPGAAPTDSEGHGTMVAGIAAANTHNGVGVAGAAWTGRIMPIKVFGPGGTAFDSDIAEGIIWAADRGAKIINLSLGGPGTSSTLHDAVKYATSKGAVVVVAAGNEGDDTPQYPAAYPEVLAVGATDTAGALTDFSSWGDWIDVAAPGFGIVSTGPGNQYYIGSGTSFAAPLVSGVAALVRTAYPSLTPAQVIARLKDTARDAGPRGIDPYYGNGVIDAFHAVGGAWAAEFPQRAAGAAEPNDVPARAIAFTTSITGTSAMEGDVDWYRYESDREKTVTFRVTPPAYNDTWAQNSDPILEVYDKELRLIGRADSPNVTAQETVTAMLAAGRYYVAVRNYNGAPDTRPYTLAVFGDFSAGPSPAGEQTWVWDVSPADFASGVARGAAPAVRFQRIVDPASVTADTVRLVHGRTGATVAATPAFDAATRTVVLTPEAALQDNTPYRIVVDGVRDTDGAAQAERFRTTFRTVDEAPSPVGNPRATGGVGTATLSWTTPAISDLDQVIVRMAVGLTPPSSPTSGTAVYAGTGSSVTVSGLNARNAYAFGVWVRDRSGNLSAAASARLIGSKVLINGGATTITRGQAAVVTAKVVRGDKLVAITNVPVQLYVRTKGSTTWTLVTTVTTNRYGNVAHTHKPSSSVDYKWVFRDSTAYIGAESAVRAVTVS
ncbi:type VII secretion-associated serine protease mycosin [Micromonospora pattaloongensis]|uniref:Type VII secretion-associated serine protease mycosin n=1 Tax=Micromonospora pattaloongensis TaxID=405436 RepID=A0A1H3HHL0_9ACTN|nr:S8 family serine peptidase [Micromonospora pattaloongensis]SDY15046.1 type VII secretion-associated serine protease mycosin [Micromonospora pattaloongensis]